MTAQESDNGVALAKTMLARSKGLRLRLAFGVVYALVFGPLGGWAFSAAWFVAYAALQAIELRLFQAKPGKRMPGSLFALGLIFTNGAVYGALGLAGALGDGPWGVACASLFLGGAVVNSAITTQRWRAAFIASIAPFVTYLLVIAGLSFGISGEAVHAVALAALTVAFVLPTFMLWQSSALGLKAQQKARAEAERRRLQAESAAAAKSTFIAMVSHELRTPISAILAGSEAIERLADADPATRSNAALILESGRMMRTLLNDLLDLSKMEAGRMTIEAIRVDLPHLMAEAAKFWTVEAEKKGLWLAVEGAETLPHWVCADPTRLRQVLNNLFSNAIKFTDKGGIVLGLEARPGEGDWLIRASVTDTGAGMTPEQMERLFTPYEQAQASTARTHGGTGLGLSISRQLARLMGGDLTVQSRMGVGSTFTLAVSVKEADAETPSELGPREAPQSVEDVRVLVVDDHEMNRRAVSLMLEPFGVDLTAAASGAEALDVMARARFDVVLMDVYMPKMGGLETTRRLRSLPGPNQLTPVIACTASVDPRDLDECRSAGMTGYVAKPIDPAALHAAIASALGEGDPIAESAAA